LFDVDWGRLFLTSTPLLEIFLRGTLTYLFLFFLLRIILKREARGMDTSDLLARLVHPPPLPLIKDEVLNYRNMRKELITEDELRSVLRSQG